MVIPVIINRPYNATDITLVIYIRNNLIFSHLDRVTIIINDEGVFIKTNRFLYK